MIPHRTVRLHRLQRAGSVWNGQRSVTKFGGAVLAVVLLCAATVIGRAEGYNASAGSKPEDMPSSAEGEQLMPQVGRSAAVVVGQEMGRILFKPTLERQSSPPSPPAKVMFNART
uniref:Uncharacterized protein n=1 Tax=Anopheles merus TaxID=30066 RepID=A0A182VM96_ANOME